MTPDDFYIGYETGVPARARQQVAIAVAALLAVTAGASALVVCAQQPFAASWFEFGRPREHVGIVRLDPHPRLETPAGGFLLVAPGKHGADALMAPHRDGAVGLQGALIVREGARMLEIVPGSIAAAPTHTGADRTTVAAETDLGPHEFAGEIVDAKCYLGVMNPGEGTVHRDCAGVCIRGGIPPMLVVRDPAGRRVLIALTDASGGRLNDRAAPLAGRPVEVRGRLVHRDGPGWTLRVDTIRPASR
jgi:hypothetical protein